MAFDYRLDPFTNTKQPIQITDELHVIPSNSPYTIRLAEVPQKDTPTSIVLRIRDTLAVAITTTGATTCTVAHGAWFAINDVITVDSEQIKITGIAGNVLTVARAQNSTVATTHLINAVVFGPTLEEVSAAPAARQYWPDYSTKADGDDGWNTGTILFNSSQANMTVAVTYKGTGTLVDARVINHGKAIWTTPGTYTFIAPAELPTVNGLATLWLTMCGGGGKGGTGAPDIGGGGGGGAAAIFAKPILVVIGASVTVTVGAGGTSGAGGASSFGAYASCPGGGAGNAGAAGAAGGAGGAPGGVGVNGYSANGGGGGGCIFGAGGAPGSGVGKAGSQYGGGGAGGTNAAGGNGAPGFVMVEW